MVRLSEIDPETGLSYAMLIARAQVQVAMTPASRNVVQAAAFIRDTVEGTPKKCMEINAPDSGAGVRAEDVRAKLMAKLCQ